MAVCSLVCHFKARYANPQIRKGGPAFVPMTRPCSYNRSWHASGEQKLRSRVHNASRMCGEPMPIHNRSYIGIAMKLPRGQKSAGDSCSTSERAACSILTLYASICMELSARASRVADRASRVRWQTKQAGRAPEVHLPSGLGVSW